MRASSWASMRSVWARWPEARPQARARRGLTTALQTGGLQGGGQRHFRTAGRVHDDQGRLQVTQALADRLHALPVVGQAVVLLGATPDRQIELVLGDVNPHIGVCHGGLLRYATAASFAVPA